MFPWETTQRHWHNINIYKIKGAHLVLGILHAGVVHNIVGEVEEQYDGQWQWYARKENFDPLEGIKTGLESSKDLAIKASMDALGLTKEEQELIANVDEKKE